MKIAPVTLALLAMLAPGSSRAQEGRPTPLLKSLIECRGRPDTTRLACYDERVAALARAERSGEVVVADQDEIRQSRRASFGLSANAVPTMPRTKEVTPTRIDAHIRSVREIGRGRWELTLDNDMLWRQTDDEQVFPRAGQPVTIRTAAMGSYMLKLPSRSIRVVRVR